MSRKQREVYVDPTWMRLKEEIIHPATWDIVDGLPVKQLDRVVEELDERIQAVSKSFPPGLKYLGVTRCTPYEEFMAMTRVRNNASTVDHAPSYVFMVKPEFSYNGEPLNKYFLLLPFVEQGARFVIGGTNYTMMSVLSDMILSASGNGVFARLNRQMFQVFREHHPVAINGTVYPKQVPNAKIYHEYKTGSNKPVMITKAKTTLVHYLLGWYGLSDLFAIIGRTKIEYGEHINSVSHPSDKWIVFSSSGNRPKTCGIPVIEYKPCNYKFAIPVDNWNTTTESLLSGLIYICDHFPSDIQEQHFNKPEFWRSLISKILFGRIIFDEIDQHYNTIQTYVDAIVLNKVKQEFGTDMYDFLINKEQTSLTQQERNNEAFFRLLSVILSNFNQWVSESSDTAISLFNKTFEVYYYIFYPIISKLNKMNFQLSNSKKPIDKKIMEDNLRESLPQGTVFSLIKNTMLCQANNSPNDNYYLAATGHISQQLVAAGAKRTGTDSSEGGGAGIMPLHESVTAIGSITAISRAHPNGGAFVNLYVPVTDNNMTFCRPEHEDIMKSIANAIKPKVIGYDEIDDVVAEVSDDVELDTDWD